MAWLLRSPTSRLYTQPCIQVQIKENIKALRHWPLCGEFTEFPTQSASNAENVSIWWSHHANAFRNTGPWWGSTGYRWIPHESQLSWALMFSLFVIPNKLLNKRSNCRWFQTPWLPCAVTVIPLNSSVRNTSHGSATNRSCNFVLFSCFKDQFVNYENKWILLNCLIQYAQHNLHFYFRWWLFNENNFSSFLWVIFENNTDVMVTNRDDFTSVSEFLICCVYMGYIYIYSHAEAVNYYIVSALVRLAIDAAHWQRPLL